MADSSEMWSEDNSERSLSGWIARRGWLVHGTANQSEAEVAPPVAGSPPIPQIGTSHPRNGALIVVKIASERIGPLTWKVRAFYEIPQVGSATSPDDPLNQPMQFFPDWELSSEEFDIDVDGIPVADAAGNPFDSNPTRERHDLMVTAVRNEPVFPYGKALQFADTVNAGPFDMPTVGVLAPGQALCLPMRCPNGYTVGATYVTVAYTFRFSESGFRTRLKNHGRAGFGALNVPGRFVNEDGGELDAPVLLNRNGTPMSPYVKVQTFPGDAAQAPQPAPNQPTPLEYYKPGNGAPDNGSPHAWYIAFKRNRSADFTNILK